MIVYLILCLITALLSMAIGKLPAFIIGVVLFFMLFDFSVDPAPTQETDTRPRWKE